MTVGCAEASEVAGEQLAGTGVTASRWLLLEVPGSWPRDVAADMTQPAAAQAAIGAWLAATPGLRLQYVRRPGRASRRPLAFVVDAGETRAEVRRIELANHEELASLDLDTDGDPMEGGIVLVCGHGSRDRCCAQRGIAVFGALLASLGEEQLWISSHQGGHRFAANVLVLPGGLQFGRVDVAEALALVERALAGRIELRRYRGRTCYDGAVQAAEHAVRSETGLDRVGDLRLAAVEDGTVRFRGAKGGEWRVAVEPGAGPAVPASCGDEPAPQRAFAARVVAARGAEVRAAARTRGR